jgi:ribosomal protein L37AE/L43A
MSRVSVTTFFNENGLFKLLDHKDGDPTKSYKTLSQKYLMECTKCNQQVEQRGNSVFECRRCRRSVSQGEDGKWVIKEPTGEAKIKAEKAMLKPPKVLIEVPKLKVEVVEEAKPREKAKPVAKEIPNDDDMLEFLKATAKTTSGARIEKKRQEQTRAEEADIEEPILPPAKSANKKHQHHNWMFQKQLHVKTLQ